MRPPPGTAGLQIGMRWNRIRLGPAWRPAVPGIALAALLSAADPVQPVMLPQAELVHRLDPAQEWLLLPLADWRRLGEAAAAARAESARRAGAGLASGAVAVTCSSRGCQASATLAAVVDAATAATVPLFAETPQLLESLAVAGAPGLALAGEGPTTLLLPGAGRWSVEARWSQDAPADADAGWTVSLPLPLAAALDVVVAAPAGWEAHGEGLVPDGPGRWRLAGAGRRLVFDLRPAGGHALAWGATQHLAVTLPTAGAGGTFAWSLADPAGEVPDPLRLRLPTGFTATAGGEVLADGSVAVRRDRAEVTGFVAAGAAIDLPALAGARWQGGTVQVAIAGPASLAPPAGWLPLPGEGAGTRRYAVARPGAALAPRPLQLADGIDLRAAAAIAVGGGTVRATWAMQVAAGVPLHRLDLAIPAGWRVLAVDAGTGPLELPPGDEIQAEAWRLAIDLPQALPAGTARLVAATLERPVAASMTIEPPRLAGTARSSHRILVAGDPATEVALSAPGWRLGPPAGGGGGALEPVAELVATDAAPPLTLAVRPRPPRLTGEAACWLLPRGEDTLVRLDLRLAVAGGALDAVAIDLPAALGDGWRVEAGEVVLADGRLAWAKPWTGERLVRLVARLAGDAGRTAAVRPRLRSGETEAPLRLAVAALAGERVDVQAAPAGRALEPDEMPPWSAPPPGTRILAAWRPEAAGEPGTVTARTPRLHEGPSGFLDRVELRTQLGPGGGTTLLTARLAAPGLAALPLRLPPGMTLELAAVDGEPAPVRRDGDAVAVILPGRTQVQLALRLAHPAAPGRLVLPPPRIDLPWLDTRWTVAVAPAWRATAGDGQGAMPLRPLDGLPRRVFLGSWSAPAPLRDGVPEAPPVEAPVAAEDPRLLGGAPVLATARPPAGGPALALVGARLQGERIGAPAVLVLDLAEVDRLAARDRLGRALGLAGAAALAAFAGSGALAAWRCLLVALAGGLGAAALLGLQLAAGPLLGACEALAVLAPLAAVLASIRRRGTAP